VKGEDAAVVRRVASRALETVNGVGDVEVIVDVDPLDMISPARFVSLLPRPRISRSCKAIPSLGSSTYRDVFTVTPKPPASGTEARGRG
jgi:hypothetical protein